MIASPPLQDLIRRYVALTVEKRALQEREHEIGRELESLNTLVIDGLLDAGIESQRITVDGASYSVFPATRVFARPRDGDMQALCDAIKQHGGMLRAAVHEAINLNTLSAWVRERRREEGVPDEIAAVLEVTDSPTIDVRHASR
jgi:hypothetical protein